MTVNGPNHARPQMPDEADFLAWIEGEPLPRDREAAVARALEQDKVLARRVEAMRADRVALCSMPEVTCPPGLLRAVEAQLQPVLERQMLLGLRDGTPVEDHLPVSLVQPVKRSIVAAFFRDRVGRSLALAAGLLLVVGGVSIWATMSFSRWTTPKPLLAQNGKESKKETGLKVADATGKPASIPAPEKPITIASAESATIRPDTPTPASRGNLALSKTAPPAEQPLAAAGAAAEVPDLAAVVMTETSPDIDSERAIELALEGRLVIRLRAADPTIAAQPSRIADRIRRAESPMWRLGGETPPEVLARLSPPPVPEIEPVHEPSQPMILSARGGFVSDLAPGFDGPPRPPEWLPPAKAVYMIETRLDKQALESLLNALEGTYGEALFEEATEPLPPEAMQTLNPSAVLWWNQPAAGWTRWGNVPVVIDTAR